MAAPGFQGSVVVFAALLAGGVALALRRRGLTPAVLNTPESGLVGRDGVVIPFAGPGLRVRVGDSDWAARGDALPAGTTVRVEAVEGTVLRVRPLD